MKAIKRPVSVDVLLGALGFELIWVDPATKQIKHYKAVTGADEMAWAVSNLLGVGKIPKKPKVSFATDANGKKLVIRDGVVVGAQG